MIVVKNEDISKDEKSRMAYEARQAEIHDQMTRIKTAREEGREEARGEWKIKVVQNLLRMGLTVEQVAKGSELPIEKVEEIKKQIN